MLSASTHATSNERWMATALPALLQEKSEIRIGIRYHDIIIWSLNCFLEFLGFVKLSCSVFRLYSNCPYTNFCYY
jgi:hypothetical protein